MIDAGKSSGTTICEGASHDKRPPADIGFLGTPVQVVLLVTLLGAILFHTFQPMFLSHFDAVPGNLGDPRLNNLILEHVYQCVRGTYSLLSPGQFYPTPGTLVYSENLIANSIIYAPLRIFGLSEMSAYQAWMLVVHTLNFFSFIFLISEFKPARAIAFPITFFAISSSLLITQLGHAQLLPFFPFLISLALVFRFARKRNHKHLLHAFFFSTLQHFLGIYLGVFSTVLLILVTLSLYFIIDSDTRSKLLCEIRRSWRTLTITAVLSAASLALLYGPYAHFSLAGGSRPLESIEKLSPTIGHWFTAPETSLLYGRQAFLKPGAIRVESELFGGWTIVAIMAVVLLFARKLTASCRGRTAIALVIITIAIMAAVTMFPFGGASWSPYLAFAKAVPPIRAIRAIGRIALLLHLLQAIAALLLLQLLYRQGGVRHRAAAVIVAMIMALEVVSLPGRSFSKSHAEARVSQLTSTVDPADQRRVLAYLPALNIQPVLFAHLDAWFAAIRLGKVTVNGYSGTLPDTHLHFLAQPDSARLRELLETVGLDPGDVIVVTTESRRSH